MLAADAGCELDVQRGPDWLIIRMGPWEADVNDAPPLADQIWTLAQNHLTYRVVLELDQINVLNSRLIGQLIRLYQRIREHDGLLRICGLSPYNRRVLHQCALDDRFRDYETREEAVLGGRDPRLPR
jgi:anti-anti-sigma factor